MLKLPKGLKKKKKKSKKNQELFTEEELAAYKQREHEKQEQAQQAAAAAAAEDSDSSVQPTHNQAEASGGAKGSSSGQQPVDDDEWSKFKSLTTGIDTVLKKTQGNLDRIKESSFFQRVPTKEEKRKAEQEKEEQERKEAAAAEAEHRRVELAKAAAAQPTAEESFLASAVVELTESEEESDDGEDIFDTAYIDTLANANVELYVPESPEEEFDAGPDPFDTAYADKVIKGPEVSKKGKKLVNIGSAVEVLTGRVEKVAQSTSRRPRRGIQNLLLSSFDEGSGVSAEAPESLTTNYVEPPVRTLLDDIPDDIPGGPIDLTSSLHLQFLKEKQEKEEEAKEEEDTSNQQLVSEFDSLNAKKEEEEDEFDEFAELATESLAKHEEVQVLSTVHVDPKLAETNVTADWAAFADTSKGGPPARPPPPRIAASQVPIVTDPLNDDDEFPTPDDDDPFDTTFAERVLPLENDDDFDPRKEESTVVAPVVAPVAPVQPEPIDLLNQSNIELDNLPHPDIVLPQVDSGNQPEIDPFDTTAIESIVKPKATEIRFLEQEFVKDSFQSLDDPDFDPRAEEPIEDIPKIDLNRRKSSLSLNISSLGTSLKSVGFSTDLLGVNDSGGSKIQKPLTPYYSQKVIDESDKEAEDPFDTSFVPAGQPSQVELNILEKDLLDGGIHRSLSDPDFDPRAVTPIAPTAPAAKADLLAVDEVHNTKVLTPANEQQQRAISFAAENSLDSYSDPFDTSSVERTILPGRAELKIIESELLPDTVTEYSSRITVLDSCSDSQELGLGGKVLTPQVPFSAEQSLEEQDPFDTSIANNLAPGQAEIKLLESELIHQ